MIQLKKCLYFIIRTNARTKYNAIINHHLPTTEFNSSQHLAHKHKAETKQYVISPENTEVGICRRQGLDKHKETLPQCHNLPKSL